MQRRKKKLLRAPPESSKLIEVLVALNRVHKRDDLIGWADGQLSDLIDFSSMACLLAEPYGKSYRVRDVIASGTVIDCLGAGDDGIPFDDGASGVAPNGTRRPHRDNAIAQASHALIGRWMQDRGAVRVGVTAARGGETDVAPLFDCFAVDSIAMHGVKEAFSGSATFFMLGAGGPLQANALDTLELIMPSLHMARQRIYRTDRAQRPTGLTVGLTAREIKVLAMIADGKTDEESARSTGRSVHTIKNQVRHVVAKLGAKNRTQAVLLALHHDLLCVDD